MAFVVKRNRLGELLSIARHVAPIIRRGTAASAVLTAVVFIVLSCQNPGWSYEFVWRGGFSSFARGWLYPFDDVKQHSYITAVILVAGFCGILFVRRHWVDLVLRIDRSWAWLSGAAVVSIMVTSLIVNGSEGAAFQDLEAADAIYAAIIANAEHELLPQGRPDIQTPIDFEYLDRLHVGSLYNQIQPELAVMRRTTEESSALKGSVGVETPAVTAEIGKTKNNNSSASLERIQFLPERQCVEVMKYVLNAGTATYYTNAKNWRVNRLIRHLQEDREVIKGAITKDNLEKLRSTTMEEDEKASERELNDQLSTLDGLVFVSGQFLESRQTGNDLVLTREFSDKPQRIAFRVNLESGPNAPDLRVEKETRLTVFSRVTKPLGPDGIIEIRPIAIF